MSAAASLELFAGTVDDVTGPDADQEAPPIRARSWRSLVLLAFGGVLVLILVVSGFVRLLVEERRTVVLAGVEGRLHALASGRAETLGAWLDAQAGMAKRLTRSDVVQLFVAESGMAVTDARLRSALNEQRPYMRQVVNEFTAQHGLVGVYVFDRASQVVLRDRDAPDPAMIPISRVETGNVAVAAPRIAADRILLDISMPIPMPQRLLFNPERTAGWLVMTLDATERLQRVLAAGDLALPGERSMLQFETDAEKAWLTFEDGLPVAHVDSASGRQAVETGFRQTTGSAGFGQVFMVGSAVPGTGWVILQEQDADQALAPVTRYAMVAYWSLGGGFALFAALLTTLFQWQRTRYLNRLVRLYQDLAGRLMRQKRLLSQVMTATRDWIAVKDRQGRFLFVNPAYAEAVGCPAEAIVGRSGDEVLSPEVSMALATACRGFDGDGAGVRLSEEMSLEIGGSIRHLEGASGPIYGAGGEPAGELTVFHDVTDLAVERQRRRELADRTVAAFQRAVELIDPYLLGHTRRLQETAGRIAIAMQPGDRAAETLHHAAGLSQLGKLFIAREIVAKQGRHTPGETLIMQQHISHAVEIAQAAGLSAEVCTALVQMHERLDGTGYPQGLADDDIDVTSRILAVADVFCARTTPRSYRDHLPASEVIALLRDNACRYDSDVVDALERCWSELEWCQQDTPNEAV